MKSKPKLNAERLRELLHYDPETGVFTWSNKTRRSDFLGRTAGSITKGGYVEIGIDNVSYYAHQLAWLYMTGGWPADLIDHEDTRRNNNVWLNLRIASYSQNGANSKLRADNKSGRKGVYWHRAARKWAASIKHNQRITHLGLFETVPEAAEAYEIAARDLHGEFARAA
jgi:hypothetical protein